RTGLVDRSELILGAAPGASLGLDDLDDPHFPALPNRYLDLYTRHQQTDPGWTGQELSVLDYRTEIGPPLPAAGRTVDFSMRADQSGSVDLTWLPVDDPDLDPYQVVVRDVNLSLEIDMRQQSGYTVPMQAGTRPFQLIIR